MRLHPDIRPHEGGSRLSSAEGIHVVHDVASLEPYRKSLPSNRGIVDVYGKKNVGFLHLDAHLDRGFGKFGAFYHSGSYMTMAVDEGLLDGKEVVQFGMSTPVLG